MPIAPALGVDNQRFGTPGCWHSSITPLPVHITVRGAISKTPGASHSIVVIINEPLGCVRHASSSSSPSGVGALVARSIGALGKHGALGLETITAQQMQELKSFRRPARMRMGAAVSLHPPPLNHTGGEGDVTRLPKVKVSAKGDLGIWQTRPMHTAKESYCHWRT